MNSGRSSTVLFLTVALSLTNGVFSQSATDALTSLSTNCQSAATSLLTGSLASCADIAGLVSVATASGSIISPLNDWIEGVCSQTCSSSALSSAQSTVVSGCSTDLTNGNEVAEALYMLTANYTQLQDLLCLQQSSNNSYCISEFLTDVQDSTGTTLSLSTLSSIFGQDVSQLESMISTLPTSELCSDCNKAVLIKASGFLNSTESSTLTTAASSKCGASFVDGTLPSDIKDTPGTASNSTSSSSSSGASSLKVAMGGALVTFGGLAMLI